MISSNDKGIISYLVPWTAPAGIREPLLRVRGQFPVPTRICVGVLVLGLPAILGLRPRRIFAWKLAMSIWLANERTEDLTHSRSIVRLADINRQY